MASRRSTSNICSRERAHAGRERVWVRPSPWAACSRVLNCQGFSNGQQRRQQDLRIAKASGEDEVQPSDLPSTSGESPLVSCISACMAIVKILEAPTHPPISRLDNLLDYVPDSLLDKVIAKKKRKTGIPGEEKESDADTVRQPPVDITFDDILSLMKVGDIQSFFDSFAMRLLVFQLPSPSPGGGGPRILSSLMKNNAVGVHRVLVCSGREEEVLTVTLQLQESLVGSQYRMAPRLEHLWRLQRIQGEVVAQEDAPWLAGPGLGPEAVVLGQLEALRRRDIPGVFSFASPRNKAISGPLDRFARLLETPIYKPLLGHTKAESLRRLQMTKDTYAEVVGVVNGGVKFVYVWSVCCEPWRASPAAGGEQGRGSAAAALPPSLLPGEEAKQPPELAWWMVNSVQLVSASPSSDDSFL